MSRFLRKLGLVLALTAAMLALLPFWLGLVLRWGAHPLGASFGTYERIGYARFALSDIVVDRDHVHVEAARLEADTPLLWLWRLSHHQPTAARITRWRVEVRSGNEETPVAEQKPGGWVPLRAQLFRIAAEVDHWLPEATLGPGEVHWPTGQLLFDSAHWKNQTLAVDTLHWQTLAAPVQIAFRAASDELAVQAALTSGDLKTDLLSRAERVEGRLEFWNQPGALTVRFPATGWVPDEAHLTAADWRLPGDRLKLGTTYAAVQTKGHVDWVNHRFEAAVTAKGEPVHGANAPPLDVDARGHGNLDTFLIEALQVEIPGLQARLEAPVEIDRAGRLRSGASRFTIDGDLARQPWFPAQGRVKGDLELSSGPNQWPQIRFTVAGDGLRLDQWAITHADASGLFAWPTLRLDQATIDLAGNETLHLQGEADLSSRVLAKGSVEGKLSRAALAPWWPEAPDFRTLALTVNADGPLASPRHHGTAQISGLRIQNLNAIGLDLTWSGVGADRLDTFEATAKAGSSSLAVAGQMNRESARIDRLRLTQGAEERLHLAAPAQLQWRPALTIGAVQLIGPKGGGLSVSGQFGRTGRVSLEARDIPSTWFDDWIEEAKRFDGNIAQWKSEGEWHEGPMVFHADAAINGRLSSGRNLALALSVKSEGKSIKLDALRLTENDQEVFIAAGEFPFVLRLDAPSVCRVDEHGPLMLKATSRADSAFWRELFERTGVQIEQPRLDAALSGSWDAPQGELTLQAERVSVDPRRIEARFPVVEALDLKLTADRSKVNLDTFSIRVQDQTIRASGQVALPGEAWRELRADPWPFLQRRGELRVQVPDADIAALGDYLPAFLAPKGRLQIDANLKPGGQLDGFVRLQNAASRPLGPLGVLQEISADIRLAGRTAELRAVTAKAGGQEVKVTGTATLPDHGPPRFDVALRGANLPFVRQSGVLLRGDVDLKLATAAGGQTRLSGTTTLRDSLFSADVRALIPSGGARAANRPPYFSVDTKPLDSWQLAVDVRGDRFLRLRTPVFNGVASARFRLEGTLGEPRAIGEVTIDQGQVLLPFASFDVQQGWVRLTEADPFEPHLSVNGTSRRYGYDLRLEVSGTASTPDVVFSSSPPLDSEQVVLMVMAGETPHNEVTYSATQRATRFGTFLGQSLLNSLSADSGSSDRLSITSGEDVSRQGRETYNIEYQLNDRWSLVGEYDEFDDYNAGVKWKVFTDERTKDEKKK